MTGTLTAGAGTSRPGGARGWVGLALLLLVGAVLLTVADLGRAGSTEPLHPQNPTEDGARAVARVLADHGVDVEVVGSDRALRRTDLDAGTTLVVTGTGELGTSTYATVRDALDRAGTTVLVTPPDRLLDELDVTARSGSPIGGSLEAECDLPLLEDLTVDAVGTPYAVGGETGDAACFRTGPGAELPGLVATTGDTLLVGAAGLLTNDTVDEPDNAAVALRVLGQHPRVVWYHATADDLAAGDERADATELSTVLPRWLGPGLLLVAVAVLLALLWQGRRFGPLVVEPLPVTVRADETEASRGRLYRAARDRRHAAAALRADARSAWRERLHLPPTASVDDLVDHLAARAGAPDRRTLHALLADGPVADDRALLRLAVDLAALTDPHPGTGPGKDRP
ncbi:DUF4350 domain-containing protein [Nocardioides marmoribigeumensis]|uniref:DUF4350 domain-containing protein n=1 Tax=Nocardioides marmoribigeumensis TaxID=433649 RepID=A0ABU2BX20_9ACTN|nr:DUF4350 domain-containing protein [Nocardioides marmoribigeumensis]MDR7362946.1 hypothetical protein [Nocardioides marmoribigeumensis]